ELQKLIERTNFGKAPTIAANDGAPNAGPARIGRALPQHLENQIREMPALADKLEKALVDDPPLSLKEGGIFRDGYDADLDVLRQASRDGKSWISHLQEREIAATGIKSLKARYNSVFGYFIEVTKSHLANVPVHYTRKQTTVGGERFITPELKEIEAKILGADERARQLEYQLFQKLRDETLRELGPIQQTAEAIAVLDVICALAETARLFRYCRPMLNETLRLVIKDGRHPVLDQTLIEEKFVPNDTSLDGENLRLAIITGPNMAGKSTYIRQVALIVLVAQIGSFVPATSAEIGLVDRIFTRVGANDDLARGQSTFMVEMNETSNIVNNATERSLVILDEIGRGTSTFDGLSIAWSVAEFLHDKIKARTLFATHYHELTKLAEDRSGVCNFNVAVREWSEQIIFLRKIIPGGADKSYGIQVARLAGLPKEILDRAKEILARLEKPDGAIEPPTPEKPRDKRKPARSIEKPQMDLL
ncbi:MAG: DNA mismatch repair protein MutS, partial [Candidatus Udaeobacter sp.]